MTTLGISAFHHDSAAALVSDNKIVAASHEERFSRQKFDNRWPVYTLRWLQKFDHTVDDVVFFDKMNFIKRREIKSLIKSQLDIKNSNIHFLEHHESHALSSIKTSGWDTCAVMVIDTKGGHYSTSLGYWDGKKIHWLRKFPYPQSLGLFYSSITRLLGFTPNSDESKVMSAAMYGYPKWKEYMEKYLVSTDKEGSYWVEYDLRKGLGYGVTDFDIAASAQQVLEDIIINLVKWLQKRTGQKKLAYSGGVALNCVANTRILQNTKIEDIWIQPAAGDAGGALGAALKIEDANWKNAYLGYDVGDILDPYEIATQIISGKIVPVCRGRAEWGPRALGNRSLLALPTKINNLRLHDLKGREHDRWRPWAPICLKEAASTYFDVIKESHEMLYIAYSKTKKWYSYPDKSARLQIVSKENNPWLYEVLKITTTNGHPILVNTSLNLKGTPIVNNLENLQEVTKNINY